MVKYSILLLVMGLFPTLLLWVIRPRLLQRYYKTLITIVLLILGISIPWEAISVNHIWYYSSSILVGPSILGIPIEEYVFFIIDGLLIGTLALWLYEVRRE